MTHTWEADGSLTLAWINPENPEVPFDQIMIWVGDQAWKDVFYISLPNNLETVNIPASVIDDITITHNPSQIRWQVKTRSYNGNLNYARGASVNLEFTWEDFE